MTRSLLLALSLSLFLALSYGGWAPGLYEAGVSHVTLSAFKASSIIVLALIAWTAGASRANPSLPAMGPAVHNKLLTSALLFGAAGDALLALGPETFLAGAGVFLIGHSFYIALFVRAGIGVSTALKTPWRVLAMLAIVAASIGMTAALVPGDSAMLAPLSIYTGVLTLMTLSAFTLPAARWLAMLGAVLFFISDGFVAANMFHPQAGVAAFWLSFAGWMIYWAGQAGLCVGALGLHSSRKP